jgi:uncharacterized protein (DUF1501 family)
MSLPTPFDAPASALSALTRRALIQKVSALSVAKTATPLALSMAAMAEASAQTANDYKALVCIFLYGANDHYNTVVPYDQASYNDYYAVRKGAAIAGTPYEGIALTRSSLSATALAPLADGRQMALGPQMTGMKSLFDAKRAAVMLNIGTLVQPTTKAQYDNHSVPLPPKLFSHNDQAAYWQSGLTEGATSGWGGRMADLLLAGNSNASLTCISVNGDAVLLSGKDADAYQISASGLVTVNALKTGATLYGSSACASALSSVVRPASTNPFENEHTSIMRRALSNYDTLAAKIGAAPSTALNALFPTSTRNPNPNSLSAQLKMVARLIEQRAALGMKRQVFMVGLGGFDLHDFLPNKHPDLLQKLSDAAKEFDDAMAYLGVNNQVTSFTASDFGRTLASNGDGSDHGWGSHHFVMGGAVNGGQHLGLAPPVGVNHSQQVGSGRLLPSTSVEQLAAELARWMGTSTTDISTILPNAHNFNLYKLGLMKA